MALSQLGFKYFLKFDYISSRSFYPALKKDLFGKNLNIQRFTFFVCFVANLLLSMQAPASCSKGVFHYPFNKPL